MMSREVAMMSRAVAVVFRAVAVMSTAAVVVVMLVMLVEISDCLHVRQAFAIRASLAESCQTHHSERGEPPSEPRLDEYIWEIFYLVVLLLAFLDEQSIATLIPLFHRRRRRPHRHRPSRRRHRRRLLCWPHHRRRRPRRRHRRPQRWLRCRCHCRRRHSPCAVAAAV